ncbi:hypothetical protein [Nocardia beijingensis]|uniref:hypothetical protein n=1 Tax=Nocardia beijingensis TaxID=95162 RepID=UPI0033B359F4
MLGHTSRAVAGTLLLDAATAQRLTLRISWFGARFRPGRMRLASPRLKQIREQICLVGPSRVAVVHEHHELGVVGQLLNPHPDLTQREQGYAVIVDAPPIGVAGCAVVREVALEQTLVLGEDLREGD